MEVTMFKYIICTDDGIYQYPRTPTKYNSYESRSVYGPDIEKARIFSNAAAASNSLNYKNGNITSRLMREFPELVPPKGLKVKKIKVTYELVEE